MGAEEAPERQEVLHAWLQGGVDVCTVEIAQSVPTLQAVEKQSHATESGLPAYRKRTLSVHRGTLMVRCGALTASQFLQQSAFPGITAGAFAGGCLNWYQGR